MDLLIWAAIAYILYLFTKNQALVTSSINAIPTFSNNLPNVLPTTSLAANSGQTGINPSNGVSTNPDGTINVPGGVLIPPVATDNEYTLNGVVYGPSGQPVAYQYLPNVTNSSNISPIAG